MPHLDKLWKNGTRILNVPLKEVVWSAKSMIMTQCNLPLYIYANGVQYAFDFVNIPFNLSDEIVHFPCSFDIFNKAGYETKVFYQQLSGCEQIFQEFFKKHTNLHIIQNHYADYLYSKILKIFRNGTVKEPFYYMLIGEDTHPPKFHRPDYCANQINISGLSRLWASYQCADFYLNQFLIEFQKTKYANNTIILIMGDHPLVYAYDLKDFPLSKRKFLFLFPYLSNKSIEYEVSPWDLYPTLLDLAGIEEYQPKAPFGLSFFMNKTRPKEWITDRDYNTLAYMYNLLKPVSIKNFGGRKKNSKYAVKMNKDIRSDWNYWSTRKS